MTADLPYTHTDDDGARLVVIRSTGRIEITEVDDVDSDVVQAHAIVSAPTGEDAAECARAVLANPGPDDVRYVVVPEWQVIDPQELAAEKRAYAEGIARSMRDRAAEIAETPGEWSRLETAADRIRALPLLPGEDPRGVDVHVATPEGITPCGEGHHDVTVTALISEATCLGCLRTLAQATPDDTGDALPAEDLVEPGDEVPTLCELADRVTAIEERLSPPEKQGTAAPVHPTPTRYRDRNGDVWKQFDRALYALVEPVHSDGTVGALCLRSLEHVRDTWGPLTPITDDTAGGAG